MGTSVGVPIGFFVGGNVVGAGVGMMKHSHAPNSESVPIGQVTQPPVAPARGMYVPAEHGTHTSVEEAYVPHGQI